LLALPLQWSVKLGRLKMCYVLLFLWSGTILLLHVGGVERCHVCKLCTILLLHVLLRMTLLQCQIASESRCSGWQMNRAWVAQGAVKVQLAVKRASAPAVVGVLCTIGKRCLELFCGLCVCNKREWACVLVFFSLLSCWFFWFVELLVFFFVVKSYVCLSVRPPIWAGPGWIRVFVFLIQTVYCVFDSNNCHTV
jgi:hypothetical protein